MPIFHLICFSKFTDQTYFLIEKVVAERIILQDHLSVLQNGSKKSNDNLSCRLTIPRGYQFLYLPYGLVVRKSASPKLLEFLNKRYFDFIPMTYITPNCKTFPPYNQFISIDVKQSIR